MGGLGRTIAVTLLMIISGVLIMHPFGGVFAPDRPESYSPRFLQYPYWGFFFVGAGIVLIILTFRLIKPIGEETTKS